MRFTLYGKVALSAVSLCLTVFFVTTTTQDINPEEGTIRLTNGNDTFGRVEIFLDNQWGTICDDGWEFIDAIVVCRQLGFKTANLATSGLFPNNPPGVIHFENLNCHGNEESILDCRYNVNHDCLDFEAVDVSCTDYEHGDLRLVDGNTTLGRIQFFLDGQRGGICSDGWNFESANVTCRQLGFNNAIFVLEDAIDFNDSEETFYLKDVNCIGNETTLSDCFFTQTDKCGNDTYAGVVCQETALFQDGDVRLADGNETAGRVEVYFEGNWGTICDDGWDFSDALVICRQLGFKDVASTLVRHVFHPGAGFIHFEDLQCYGYEGSVFDCNYTIDHDCTSPEDVGVSCLTYDEGDLRLNGKNHSSGLVEVFIDNQWGYICGDVWDSEEAEVVCRQLAFDGVASTHEQSLQLNDVVHFKGFVCNGSESSILDCDPLPGEDCSENKTSVVTCIPFEEGAIRLVDGPDKYAGRVELFSKGTWGTICDDEWDLTDGSVVCRQLGYGDALLHTVGSFPFGPGRGEVHLKLVHCLGNETGLTSCPSGDVNCDHTEDAGVVCELSSFNTEFPVRLVEGLTGKYSGRVEVLVGSQWGTICADEWDMKGADIVCTQLGYGWALEAGGESRDSPTFALSGLECNGNETSLSHCDYSRIGVHPYECLSNKEASVICSASCLQGRCPADIETILESPSQLTTQVFWAEPSIVTSFCERVIVSSTHSPGERFQEGVTVVSYFVKDTAGTRAECNFIVNVTRKTCSEITCPPDITSPLHSGSVTTAVFWREPSNADDSCSVSALTSSHSPGDQFKEGPTVVTYFSRNTPVCNFTVEVVKEVQPIPLAATIVPSVAFLMLLIFVCLLWMLKVPKRLWRRPLPRVPKHQPSFINPAYEPSSSGDKTSDAGNFYDFILDEGEFETSEITVDTYGIIDGEANGGIVRCKASHIEHNGQAIEQESIAGHGADEAVITRGSMHNGTTVDSSHVKNYANEYSADPRDTAKLENQENVGNKEKMESEEHYIVMKNLKSNVPLEKHRGEGHEKAVVDKSRDSVTDVLVLSLGEF